MNNDKQNELSETELDTVTGGFCSPYYQPNYWQQKKFEQHCAPKKEHHPKKECEQPYYPVDVTPV